ncbi:branched-chain amino acid transaminase [Phytohabitans sp. LJ34]|uniref:branched-chain amino acid transaminase n=1 Tax=Phytohabitans sp. LJ34 TaxID=3452217 RepID=UPI003F8A900F
MTVLEKPPYIWFKDAVRPWEEATVHVWTEAVVRAASVFEGMRGYWNEQESRHYFLHMPDHMRRLADSARVARIPRIVTFEECLGALHDLLSAMPYREDVYIRPTLFLEEGRYSVGGSPDDCGFFVAIFPSPREKSITSGLRCQISSWQRADDASAPPRVKAAASYYNLRFARMEATSNGYDEAILLNRQGKVAETGGASVFLVRDGRIVTPHVGSSILESITRRSAIELLTAELGLRVDEREVERSELYVADEVFLTGTLCEITPVVDVDGLEIGDRKPGPVTRELQERYYAACRQGQADRRGWLTAGPVLPGEDGSRGKEDGL